MALCRRKVALLRLKRITPTERRRYNAGIMRRVTRVRCRIRRPHGAVNAGGADKWFVMGDQALKSADPSVEIKTPLNNRKE